MRDGSGSKSIGGRRGREFVSEEATLRKVARLCAGSSWVSHASTLRLSCDRYLLLWTRWLPKDVVGGCGDIWLMEGSRSASCVFMGVNIC